jgi:hypothetical protein
MVWCGVVSVQGGIRAVHTLKYLGAVQSTLGVGGCGKIASATCPLQLTKASAATLLHQEKNNTADVQRGRVYIWLYLYSGKLILAATYLRRV